MSEPKKDFLVPVSKKKSGIQMIRFREDGDGQQWLGSGTLTPLSELEEGRSTFGEVVTLESHGDGTYNVVASCTSPFGKTKGPAQIATKEYREGWDRIFSKEVH